MSIQTVTVTLRWTPLLNPNNHMNRWRRSALTRQVRGDTRVLAHNTIRQMRRDGATPPYTVRLHYRPARNARRDAGNLCLDSKACVDGLIDAGLAPDDTGEYVHELMPRLHDVVPGQPAELWLEISWETP